MSSNNNNTKDEADRLKYLRETNVHHLFELLASRVLTNRPQDVFGYLRQQLNELEKAEGGNNNNNQNQQQQAPTAAAPSNGGTSSSSQNQQGTVKLTLAVFGLDNAGKTALISAIGGAPNKNTTPTVGFSPTFFETDTADVAMFDLGGGSSFRSIWKHYFHDVHGIIYVVDGTDASRLAETARALQDLLSHPYIAEKPILLYINKKDKQGEFLGIQNVVNALDVSRVPNHLMQVLPICALDGEDPAIEQGVEWLLQTVKDKFDGLSSMVSKHSAEVKEQKKLAMAEQQKRVEAARAAEAAEKH